MKNYTIRLCYVAEPHGAVGYLGLKKIWFIRDWVVFFRNNILKVLDVVEEVLQ
jgi:hypothetical protein